MAVQRPGPSSGWSAHTPACRKRMEERIRGKEPDRWKRYLPKKRDEEPAEGAGSTSIGDPLLEPPALESEKRRDRNKGN